MFKTTQGKNIMHNVMTKFTGERLTISDADFGSQVYPSMLAQNNRLTHVELRNLTFGKDVIKTQLIDALAL